MSLSLPPMPEVSPEEVEALRMQSVMEQASALLSDARRLSEEEARLQDELRVQQEEAARAQGLVAEAEAELVASTEALQALMSWQEEHEGAVAQRSVAELEQLAGDNKALELQVGTLEDELAAALEEARRALDQTCDVARAALSRDAYLQQLGAMIEEQELELRRAQVLAEELQLSTDAFAENDAQIAKLRAALEAVGAAVPEAPMRHRTQHLLNRRARLLRGRAAAHDHRHDDDSGAAPRSEHAEKATRSIEVPQGVLRPLTTRLGNLRAFAAKHHIRQFAVAIEQGRSVLHCEGRFADLDAFERAILEAAAAVQNTEGIVTFKDAARAMGYDAAARGIAELLMMGARGASHLAGTAADGAREECGGSEGAAPVFSIAGGAGVAGGGGGSRDAPITSPCRPPTPMSIVKGGERTAVDLSHSTRGDGQHPPQRPPQPSPAATPWAQPDGFLIQSPVPHNDSYHYSSSVQRQHAPGPGGASLMARYFDAFGLTAYDEGESGQQRPADRAQQ